MPSEEVWQGFFDPQAILEKLGVTRDCQAVVDFGCGYGTFSIPAAQMIRGTVYALDMDAGMLAATRAKAAAASLRNVEIRQRDFVTQGTGLPDASVDYAMLFNILHAEQRMTLLVEAWRILAPGGKLAVIHWNYDPHTPRGPSMSIRPRLDECRAWVESVGFVLSPPGLVDLPPHHYGFAFKRPATGSSDV